MAARGGNFQDRKIEAGADVHEDGNGGGRGGESHLSGSGVNQPGSIRNRTAPTGSARVTAELKDSGRRVNHKRGERVMRKFHIVGLHLRKKVRTTIPEPSATPVPDLLQRGIAAQMPNTKNVGDITCLPVGNGQFLYLATVLDLCSKRLTGWSIADHMPTSLVTDVLRAAARARGGDGLRGAISHSGNGAQYVSKEFAQVCSELGVTRSRGAVGTSADKAAAESLNTTMKRGTLQGRKRWNGASEARLAVFRWATRYNTRRRTPASARSARSPTNGDQLRWPPPHDNRCPRSQGRPSSVRAGGWPSFS